MMAMNHMGTSPHEIYDDHPSLSASLEDFEHNDRSPVFGLPSQHSGFKSEASESDLEEAVSEEPWSPPAWRQQNAAGGWYRHQPYPQDKNRLKASASASRSRGTSPQYESAQEEEEDITMPANIPLPRGSMSPVKERSPSPSPYPEKAQDFAQTFEEPEKTVASPENTNNCVFAPEGTRENTDYAEISDLLSAQKYNSGRNLLKLLYRGYAHISLTSLNHGPPFHPPS